jgi:hypothetical protein
LKRRIVPSDEAPRSERGSKACDRKRLRAPLRLLVLAAFAACGTAHAALYKWTDDHGVVHYSDTLPADAVNRASTQLNPQAMIVRRTQQARAVTENLPKAEAEAQKQRDADRGRVVAERRDRALLESYANEAEIELAKSRALATIDAQVTSAHGYVAQIQKRRKELEDKKSTYAPRPVPGEIPREIETIDAELARQDQFIAGKLREAANVAARYDADKQRFRELRTSAASGTLVNGDAGRVAEVRANPPEITSPR